MIILVCDHFRSILQYVKFVVCGPNQIDLTTEK